MNYADTQIDERVLRALEEIGFETMTPIQEEAIPKLMEGKDIIGQAQTGTGKTAAFGIPMIQMVDPEDSSLQAMVLCPTRELAMQAAEELRRFAKYLHGVRILPVYGGQEIFRQIKALKGGVQIIVGTPGRVMDHMRRKTLRTDKLKMLVLDEADEMLDMGFREDIEEILQEVPVDRQTALFSATMPKPILDITSIYQKPDAEYIKVTKEEVTIDLVKQYYYYIKRDQKKEVLCRLLDYHQPKRALIFCNTKRMVDELSEFLRARGYSAEGLHGDLTQGQRDVVMNLFRKGGKAILIATDVAARGIDVEDVEAVFNYDVPDDIEYYVHRIGRTGRAGKSGFSFTLVAGWEIRKIRDIERVFRTTVEERHVPSAKDVMRAKARKILRGVNEVIETTDLDKAKVFVTKHVEKSGYTELEIAAGFLRMQLGEDLKDIEEERPPQPRKSREKGRRDRDRKGRKENREDRERSENRKDGRGEKDKRREDTEVREKRRDGHKEDSRDRKERREREKKEKKGAPFGRNKKGNKISFTEYARNHKR